MFVQSGCGVRSIRVWCSFNQGVRSIRVFVQSGCSFNQGVRSIRVFVHQGVRSSRSSRCSFIRVFSAFNLEKVVLGVLVTIGLINVEQLVGLMPSTWFQRKESLSTSVLSCLEN